MKLLALFIFNPILSTDECSADENILSYWPLTTPIDTQMNEVGFCIALMRLQERFNVPMSTESTATGSKRQPYGMDAAAGYPRRSITLSTKRITIITVEHFVYVGVVTNREILKTELGSISSLHHTFGHLSTHTSEMDIDGMGSSAVGHKVPQHIAGTPVSTGSSIPSNTVICSTPNTGEGFPANAVVPPANRPHQPFLASPPHSSEDSGTSNPFWDVPNSIAPTNDETDDYVEDVVAKLVVTAHKMFKMMFGSVRWNFDSICLTEVREGKGLAKRPKYPLQTPSDEMYESDRRNQRARFEKVVRDGLTLRLMSAILAATSSQHSLEGSFSCPEGVDVLPVDSETHLMVSSLVAQLHSAHPGALRDSLVIAGRKSVYSTLSALDTETLFNLMKYYTANPALANSDEQQGVSSAFPHLESGTSDDAALHIDCDADVEEQGRRCSQYYSPEAVMASERRRSDFLRSSIRFVDVDDAQEGQSGRSSPSRAPGSPLQSTALFPFLFIDDNDPVGVYSSDIGCFRFIFLVNEKYLRLAELRAAFETSLHACVASSHIPKQLRRRGSAIMAQAKSQQRKQNDLVDSQFLYYYRSQTIRQVRSSIVLRLTPCPGSFVCPPLSRESRNDETLMQRHERGSITAIKERFLSSVSNFSFSSEDRVRNSETSATVETSPNSAAGVDMFSFGGETKRLKIDEREAVHLLDRVRSDLLKSSAGQSSDASTFILVKKKVWAAVVLYGSRDLSCVVRGKDTFDEAEATVEMLSRLVFYYSFRPPGI